LRLYQDGESTPVSDLMGRENHILSVVPKMAVQAEVDWRLPVFEAGKYLVAFDGAALLLLELWRRVGDRDQRSEVSGQRADLQSHGEARRTGETVTRGRGAGGGGRNRKSEMTGGGGC